MTDRLPARLEVDSLMRRATAEGGFAAVLHKGDDDRGVILLLLTTKGLSFGQFERRLARDGQYRWEDAGPSSDIESPASREWREKRVRSDRDLWVIELDIPDPERFIAETIAIG